MSFYYRRPVAPKLPTLYTNDDLRRYASSVFATQPHEKMSPGYRFIPTIEIVERMRDNGFQVVKANQSRTTLPGMRDFVKHLLRFRHTDYLTATKPGDSIPEILLTNSHNGNSTYQLNSGIFELVCTNGLVVQSEKFGDIRIRHSGEADLTQRVIDATFQIVEDTPKVMAQIENMKNINLNVGQQMAFATSVNELLSTPVPVHSLLNARRPADSPNIGGDRSLWKTLNVVQEHVITGGDRTIGKTGKRTKTRAVKSVDKDIRLNKAIWRLGEEIGKLVS